MMWLNVISDYSVKATGGPNFAYAICAERARSANTDLDLSVLRMACNGAEPVRSRDIEAFETAFAPHGLRKGTVRPSYGLAEASLIVTGSRPDRPVLTLNCDARQLTDGIVDETDGTKGVPIVSCGSPPAGVAIASVIDGHEVPDGRIGEIWVRSASVGRGYWGRPQESKNVFCARIEGRSGFWLRTGDAGFIKEGQLFITGRLKAVLIVRGRKYHAEDLEGVVQSTIDHHRLSACAAFQMDDGSVCLVCESQLRGADAKNAAKAVQRACSRSRGILVDRVIIVKRRAIPKTRNGKIDRIAVKRLFENPNARVIFDSYAVPNAISGKLAATGADRG